MTLCRNPAHSRSKSNTKKQSKFQFLPLFSIKIQTPDYQSQTNRISSVGAFSFPQLAHFCFLSWRIFVSSVGKNASRRHKKIGQTGILSTREKVMSLFLEFISYVEKQGNVVSLCVVCNMQEAVAGSSPTRNRSNSNPRPMPIPISNRFKPSSPNVFSDTLSPR